MSDPADEAVRAVKDLADRQYLRMQTPRRKSAMQSLMDASEEEICVFLEQYYATGVDKA
jgi:hypothetical protein